MAGFGAPDEKHGADAADDELGPGGPGPLLFYREGAGLAGLPTRDELVARGRPIEPPAGEPVLFWPVAVEDAVDFAGGVAAYALRITGCTADGAKAEVTLVGVEPSFEAKVPDDETAEAFGQRLCELAAANGAAVTFEALEGYRSLHDGFREAPGRYIRVLAADLANRKKAMGAALHAGLELYGNDRSDYYRKLAREEGLPLCGWAVLRDYAYTRGPTPRARCRHLFRLAPAGYRPLPDPAASAALREEVERLRDGRNLERPPVLCLCWDLETIDDGAPGQVPQPLSPTSHAFMASVTAHWLDDPRPLAAVILTDVPAATDPRWATVVCGPGGGVLKALALVLQALAPDVLFGFNDSEYDWPFVVEKARQGRYLAWWWNTVAARPRDRQTDEGVYRWDFVRDLRIKVTSDKTFTSSYLKVPGCVMADMRPCFQKLYPKLGGQKAGSLKKYLAACDLPPKADMPVGQMWRAFRRAVAARKGADPGEAAAAAELMREVAHYNYVDSLRCQQMQVRRSVLKDCFEVSAVAFTSLADALYRAGGMKVRNLLGAGAAARRLLVSATVRPADGGKYPGAFVLFPAKGLSPDPGRLAAVVEAAAALRAAPEEARPRADAAFQRALGALAPYAPLVGLDFASLYPSLIMAFNLSPEMAVFDPAEAKRLAAAGRDLHAIKFEYGGQPVRAWTVRHGNDPERFGLYAATLQKLFDRRAALKKAMEPHAAVKEVLELVAGRAEREQVPLAEAAQRAYKEALAEQDRLSETKYPEVEVPPGCTREEALAERRRDRAAAAEQARLLAPLLAAGDPAAVEAAIRLKEAEARFAWACLDAKQKALKVYMNTFYGELGNKLSPLFVVALAGGVTSAGQHALLEMVGLARAEGFLVNAGDTDSLYVVAPPKSFAECDEAFAHGRLSLEDWSAARVRITMRVVGGLRDRLNAALRASSGTAFLKLSYEDVLFPVALTGKKKYYGIAHVNRVNFRPKELFVRGIDVIKEGVPAFARAIGNRVMWRSVSLDNRLPLRAIVEDVIRDALQHPEQWKFDDFVRTAAWKPDKKNQTVHLFMERMRALAALEAAELKRGDPERPPLYALPEPGERFEYVVVAADPYGLDGYKLAHRVGDHMELAAVARARGLRLDMAYYFKNIVAGLCARFIAGEPEFQPPGATPGLGADDAELKAADLAAQKAARRHLEQFIARVGQEGKAEASKRGDAYRRAFVRASGQARAALAAEARGLAPGATTEALAVLHAGWPAPAPETKRARAGAEADRASVDAMWRAAAARGADLAKADLDAWLAHYCRLRGIAPGGGDLASPGRRPGACLLRETAAAPRSVANGLDARWLAELCAEEGRVRAEAGALLERAGGLAARYRAALAGLVEGHRRAELAARRRAEPEAAPADPVFGLSAGDLEALEALRGAWHRAVGLELTRARARLLAARLADLRARCGALPPSGAELARHVAAAAPLSRILAE